MTWFTRRRHLNLRRHLEREIYHIEGQPLPHARTHVMRNTSPEFGYRHDWI